jgi:hypothetical protein
LLPAIEPTSCFGSSRAFPSPASFWWRFSRSNGITEGFHSKMKLIQRRAFGFRNFENDRRRVRALCA